MPQPEWAYHDDAHCLTPGLFRGLKRARHRPPLHESYCYSDAERLTFSGPAQLGPEDLLVLQGIMAIASVQANKQAIPPQPVLPVSHTLRQHLELQGSYTRCRVMMIRTTKRRLLTECGLTASGRSMRMLHHALQRLAATTSYLRGEPEEAVSRLIAYTVSDGQLYVALSPRLSRGADAKASYTMLNMREVRRLRSGPARLLHQRLSASVSSRYRERTLNTLMKYVWYDDRATPDATKKRRYQIKKALNELAHLGWHIESYAPEKYRFILPAKPTGTRCVPTLPKVRAHSPHATPANRPTIQ